MRRADASCALTRWQQFSAWNEVMDVKSKIRLCQSMASITYLVLFTWRTILPISSRSYLRRRNLRHDFWRGRSNKYSDMGSAAPDPKTIINSNRIRRTMDRGSTDDVQYLPYWNWHFAMRCITLQAELLWVSEWVFLNGMILAHKRPFSALMNCCIQGYTFCWKGHWSEASQFSDESCYMFTKHSSSIHQI